MDLPETPPAPRRQGATSGLPLIQWGPLQCVEPPGERVPFERIEFNGSETNTEKWFGLNCIRGPGGIFVRFRGKEYSTDTIGNLQVIITADEEEDFCIRFDDY